MSHTDFGQLDLAALRAAAGEAKFAEAGPVSSCGYPLADTGPLACGTARSLSEAGLSLHDCAAHDPLFCLGGVCLLQGGQRRYNTDQDAHQAMNAALGSVLIAFGYQLAAFGGGGAWLVVGRRSRGREAEQ